MKKLTPNLRQRKTSTSSVSTQALPSRSTIHKKRPKKPLWLILGISLVFLLISGFMYSLNEEKSNKEAYSPRDVSAHQEQPTSEEPLYSYTSENEKSAKNKQSPQSTSNKKSTTASLLVPKSNRSQKSLPSESRLNQPTQETKQNQTEKRPIQSRSIASITESKPNKASEQPQKTEQNNQQKPATTPTPSTEQKPNKFHQPEKKGRPIETNHSQKGSSSPSLWNPNKKYQTGDTVLYNGKIYKANWPNRNKKPGDSFYGFQYWSEKETSTLRSQK